MNENPPSGDFAQNTSGGIKQGIDWIVLGMRTVLDRKPLWFGMTAVYLVLGFLLKLIPFMGDLLLVLITPMLLAGVLWGRAQENPAGRVEEAGTSPPSAPGLFQAWVTRPIQVLLRIFTQEDKVFGAGLLGIITLVLATLVKFMGDLLIGGSMISGLAASQLSAPQTSTILGMLVVAVLYVILAMALFFSVPLTVLGNRQPLTAISDSFSICRKNVVALLTLTAPFFVVYLVILVAFAEYHWVGYLLVFSVGFLALPLFVAAAFSSYLSLSPHTPSGPPP